MSTPQRRLKIKVHPLVIIALSLSWLAIALPLTVLSGELRQFQWLLLATVSGSLVTAFAIEFGGTIACGVVPSNETKMSDGGRERASLGVER